MIAGCSSGGQKRGAVWRSGLPHLLRPNGQHQSARLRRDGQRHWRGTKPWPRRHQSDGGVESRHADMGKRKPSSASHRSGVSWLGQPEPGSGRDREQNRKAGVAPGSSDPQQHPPRLSTMRTWRVTHRPQPQRTRSNSYLEPSRRARLGRTPFTTAPILAGSSTDQGRPKTTTP